VNSLLIGATLYNENRPIEAADYSVPGGNEVFLHFFTRKCDSQSLAAAVAMTLDRHPGTRASSPIHFKV
jgi:hypothetical protein